MSELTCPKCHGSMRQYERNGVHVDQCTECRGIFLDRGELERLTEAESQWARQDAAPASSAPPAQHQQQISSHNISPPTTGLPASQRRRRASSGPLRVAAPGTARRHSPARFNGDVTRYVVLLRGVNVGGHNKVPNGGVSSTPDRSGLHRRRDVSPKR